MVRYLIVKLESAAWGELLIDLMLKDSTFSAYLTGGKGVTTWYVCVSRGDDRGYRT